MNNEPKTAREIKYVSFHNQINYLERKVEQIEFLLERIEGKDRPTQDAKVLEQSAPSLTIFLNEGGDRINKLACRLENARDRISELLF
jgi:hypothetical protein